MIRTRSILCGLFLAVITSAATLAQSSKTKSDATPSEPPTPVLVTMKFGGGTAADYIQAVRKAAGDVNVVSAIETKEVPMPPVELTNASLESALEVLDGRTVQLNDRFIKIELHVNGSGGPNEQLVYSLDAKVQGRPVDDRIMQRVWSVKSILDDGTKPNDLLTAIQTSLDLLGDATKPAQLKFHEATGLIIARASPDQIDAIQQVIEQTAGQKMSVDRANKVLRDREMELQKARSETELCRVQVARLEAELAEARKR